MLEPEASAGLARVRGPAAAPGRLQHRQTPCLPKFGLDPIWLFQ